MKLRIVYAVLVIAFMVGITIAIIYNLIEMEQGFGVGIPEIWRRRDWRLK